MAWQEARARRKFNKLRRGNFIADTTLSNRQASSTASVGAALLVTKLLECKANELNASAAALRVAQSVLVRQS